MEFSTTYNKFIFNAEDFVWTPRGMTQAEAYDQLPLICQLLLKKMPDQRTLLVLQHTHKRCVADNHLDVALRYERCLTTAKEIIATTTSAATNDKLERSVKTTEHKHFPNAEDFVWIPHGVTQAEAIWELPLKCHVLLTKMPDQRTLDVFQYFHKVSVAANDLDGTLRIERCLSTAKEIIESRGTAL
jgi:hypothetical protein